jgi:hypothetical protein
MAVKRPNGLKIYQDFPLQDPLKILPNWDFGLKTNHLATLPCIVFLLGLLAHRPVHLLLRDAWKGGWQALAA